MLRVEGVVAVVVAADAGRVEDVYTSVVVGACLHVPDLHAVFRVVQALARGLTPCITRSREHVPDVVMKRGRPAGFAGPRSIWRTVSVQVVSVGGGPRVSRLAVAHRVARGEGVGTGGNC